MEMGKQDRVMKKLFFSLAFITTTLCADVNVAVASNVSYALDAIKSEFAKEYKGIKLHITLGSSGKLSAQIKYGAPYDVFLSANMSYPQKLFEEKKALNKPVVYAQGSLAFISTKYKKPSFQLLKSSQVKRIAIANPKTAPYGKAAKEALQNVHLYKSLKKKFVYGESISQTLTYALRMADVGIVAKSSLYSPKIRFLQKNANDVDTKLYTPIKQGMVLLQKAKTNKDAKIFYEFMLSDKVKKILKDFGYII